MDSFASSSLHCLQLLGPPEGKYLHLRRVSVEAGAWDSKRWFRNWALEKFETMSIFSYWSVNLVLWAIQGTVSQLSGSWFITFHIFQTCNSILYKKKTNGDIFSQVADDPCVGIKTLSHSTRKAGLDCSQLSVPLPQPHPPPSRPCLESFWASEWVQINGPSGSKEKSTDFASCLPVISSMFRQQKKLFKALQKTETLSICHGPAPLGFGQLQLPVLVGSKLNFWTAVSSSSSQLCYLATIRMGWIMVLKRMWTPDSFLLKKGHSNTSCVDYESRNVGLEYLGSVPGVGLKGKALLEPWAHALQEARQDPSGPLQVSLALSWMSCSGQFEIRLSSDVLNFSFQDHVELEKEVRDAIYITIEILSNWGDMSRVGLTEVEFFDSNFERMFVSPHDVDIRHADPPGELSCLVIQSTNVSLQWLIFKEQQTWFCTQVYLLNFYGCPRDCLFLNNSWHPKVFLDSCKAFHPLVGCRVLFLLLR